MTDLRRPVTPRGYHTNAIFGELSIPLRLIDLGECSGMQSGWDEMTIAEAQNICGECEVRAECLAYARTNREPCGVWGGVEFPETRMRRAAA